MTARDLHAIGVRLLSLYFIVTGIASLPGVYAMYKAAAGDDIHSSGQYSIVAASQSILLIVAGVVLLRLHKAPEGTTASSVSSESVLRLGSQLLGLFFAVDGVVTGIGAIGGTLVSSDWSFRLDEIMAALLYITAGLFLFFRPAAVARAAGGAA
jgi:hypothetical protein